MNTWLAIAGMETRGFFRSKAALFWTFAYPVLLLVLMAALFGGGGPVRVVVETLGAETPASREFKAALAARVAPLDGFAIDMRAAEAGRPVAKGVVRLAIEAAPGGGTIIRPQFKAPLTPEAGSALALIGETAEGLNVARAGVPRAWQLDYRAAAAGTEAPARSNPNPVAYLITGMAALTIVSTALFGFTGVLVELRSRGALIPLQLMPIGKLRFLTAFTASRVLILVLFTTAFVLAANRLYGAGLAITPATIAGLLAVTLAGALAFLGIGLLIAAVVTKTATAQALINIVNIPVIFLSDLFIPLSAMPDWVQRAVAWSPVNGFVGALRGLLEDGAGLGAQLPVLAVLTGIAVAGFAAAAALFKWRAA